ncbi:MAG TPA: hypothetical protein VNZ26_25775 [Vicinamibacterales bacterium]|jgi:hypothetical protein|nr:hypothetical protein [Vicinamibacterales bacterium]
MLSGVTFGPTSQVLKRAKVGSKKARKALKKFEKAGKRNAFGRTPFGEDFEAACDKANLARVGKIARDTTAPRAERLWALGILDKGAFACNGVADSDKVGAFSAKGITKAEKREAKERRKRLEYQAIHGDLQARMRAQEALFGALS